MTEHAGNPENGRGPSALRSTSERIARALLAVGSAAAIGAFGVRTFFSPGLGPLVTFGPIVGIIAAIACAGVLDAAIAAAVGAIAGTLLGQAVYPTSLSFAPGWIGTMFVTALVAAAVGAVVAWVLGSSPRLGPLFAGLALVLLIAAGMLSALSIAAEPRPAEWVTGRAGEMLPLTAALLATPKQTAASPDDTIYVAVVQKLARGGDYYAAMAQALDESNRTHNDNGVPLDQPTSYRMPTLFWLLARLPQDGVSVVLAALFFTAAATVGAYLLSRRFVGPPLAMAAAAGVSAYGSRLSATTAILYTEMWAGLLGVVALALFVRSRDGRRVSVGLQIGAVLVALAAALTRELAAAFLIAGLVAVVADTDLRRARMWIAWAAGIGAALVGYALHWRASLAAFAASGLPVGIAATTSRFPWLHPDGSGLIGAVALARRALTWNSTAMWIAVAVCLVGALAIEADLGTRIMVALCGCGGLLLLVVVRAPSVAATGEALNYWAMVVVPVALACFPLAFSRLEAVRTGDALPG